MKWNSITSSIEKAGPTGSEPRGSSAASKRVSGSIRSLAVCWSMSTPAETRRATILRSARFSTSSSQEGQVNR